MTFNKKIKANALFIVVTISIIVSLILLGLTYNAGLYSRSAIRSEIQNQLIRNSTSSLEYCLAQDELIDNVIIDLFNENRDSVLIHTEPFGLLNWLTIKAFHGMDTISSKNLIGSKIITRSKTALYVGNTNSAIGVCGKTLLGGNVFVPERGISRSYVEGQSFTGNKLFEGTKEVCSNTLPPIHSSLQHSIQQIFLKQVQLNPIPEMDTIINKDDVIHYYEMEEIIIDQLISGGAIIESNTKITVTSNSKLSNVILIAPFIFFEEDFSGSVQAFAADSIIAESNCSFKYPSNLIVKSKNENSASKLKLGRKCSLKGNVLLLQNQVTLKNNGILSVESESIIEGEVYSQALLELNNCEIYGSVYGQKLYLKTQSSVYENLLLNVKIEPHKKDSNMIDLGLERDLRGWVKLM